MKVLEKSYPTDALPNQNIGSRISTSYPNLFPNQNNHMHPYENNKVYIFLFNRNISAPKTSFPLDAIVRWRYFSSGIPEFQTTQTSDDTAIQDITGVFNSFHTLQPIYHLYVSQIAIYHLYIMDLRYLFAISM